jgi:hypothetical protein
MRGAIRGARALQRLGMTRSAGSWMKEADWDMADFKCEACGQTFLAQAELDQHTERMHGSRAGGMAGATSGTAGGLAGKDKESEKKGPGR